MKPSALRHPPSAFSGQAALDLAIDRGASPDLREAYDKSNLAYHGITLERALKLPHLAIPLRRVAETLANMRIEGSVQ